MVEENINMEIKNMINIMGNITINKKIPDRSPDIVETDILRCGSSCFSNIWRLRDKYTHRCSWCLVAWDWVKPLYDVIKGGKIISLYSGLGLLDYALESLGAKIDSYDSYDWNFTKERPTYKDVINKDALEALKDYPKDSIDWVIMSWVPHNDTTCVDIVQELRDNQSKAKIIWVGEDMSGCNGSDAFFDETTVPQEYFDLSVELSDKLQSWAGIHDEVIIFVPEKIS